MCPQYTCKYHSATEILKYKNVMIIKILQSLHVRLTLYLVSVGNLVVKFILKSSGKWKFKHLQVIVSLSSLSKCSSFYICVNFHIFLSLSLLIFMFIWASRQCWLPLLIFVFCTWEYFYWFFFNFRKICHTNTLLLQFVL